MKEGTKKGERERERKTDHSTVREQSTSEKERVRHYLQQGIFTDKKK